LAAWDLAGSRYQLQHKIEGPNSGSEEKISLKDIKDFPLSLWLLVFICVTFYIGVFVFTQNGGDFFKQKWQLDPSTRDNVLSIPSTFSAVASPFLGFGVDRIGMSLTWVISACLLLAGVHLFMALTAVTPIVGMVFMGASYSVCAAALWPCVALLMPNHQLGTAYGLMTAMQNLGLAVAPLGIGAALQTTNHNWLIVELIFAAIAGVSALFTLLLILVDIRNGRKLNSSPLKCLGHREDVHSKLSYEKQPLLQEEQPIN